MKHLGSDFLQIDEIIPLTRAIDWKGLPTMVAPMNLLEEDIFSY